MKRLIIICVLAGFSFMASAQSDHRALSGEAPVRFVPGSAILTTNPATGMPFQSTGSPFAKPEANLDKLDEGNANGVNDNYSNNNNTADKQEKKTKANCMVV